MFRLKFLIAFLFLVHQFVFAKKYALIIAIGKYAPETKWNQLSSSNDIPLIKGALLNQGFSETDITVIQDEKATKNGILSAINTLKSKISPGDIVVIHYSGHGQQVMDDNDDEVDGLDESLVPYDAWKNYNAKYKGENHLRDDEILNVVNSIRNTLGKSGQLLMILDSCHSGNATRGPVMRGGASALVPDDWKAPTQNGKISGGGLFEAISLQDSASPFIVISGASDSEPNFEYDGVGSLSYAFSKAMNELGSDFTYRKLFSNIASTMNSIVPDQKPTIEGNIDYKLFKGEYVQQQPFFDVTNVSEGNTILTINGGQINRIFNNTTVLVMPAGTQKADANKVLSKGKITNSAFATSTVTLDKPVKTSNFKDYWVFIDQPSYGDFEVKVFVDSSIKDSSIKLGISQYLKINHLGKIVDNTKDSDVIVEEKEGKYLLSSSTSNQAFSETQTQIGTEAIDQINTKIFRFAQGNYLKNLDINNPLYEFDFKLIPINFDPSTRKISEKPENSNISGEGIFTVVPKKDYSVLQITNNSNQTIYVSIVEINSEGSVSPFFPNKNCNLTDNERKLEPKQTQIYNRCVYSFSPPYERLILKGFASDKPLNFQSTVTTRGASNNTNNPLESFLQSTYNTTRGGDGNEISTELDGYSTSFVYDIVREK